MGFSRRFNDNAGNSGKVRFNGRDTTLAAALAAAGLIVMPGTTLASNPITSIDSENVNEEVRYARQLSKAFRSVASGVAPSVVSIEVTDSAPYHGSAAPGGEAYPGGRGSMPMPPRRGGATGVVIDSKGYIVTNYHVVEGADEILVEFHDGTRVLGTLVGKDQETDLAVIQVEADDLTPARLGDSRKQPGRRVDSRRRESVRSRPDGHRWNHQCSGSGSDGSCPVRKLHPDGCRHQSGKQRRTAGQPGRRGDRDQHRDPLQQWRLQRNRIRHPDVDRRASLLEHHRKRPSRTRMAWSRGSTP